MTNTGRTFSKKALVTEGEYHSFTEGGSAEIVVSRSKPSIAALKNLANQARAAMKLPPF